jgi:prolyl 4-hydroxylase
MKKKLDQSWRNWIKENVDLGIPKNEILKILLNHNFDINESRKELNIVDYNVLNFNVDNLKFISNIKRLHETFHIYEVDNFIDEEVCLNACELIRKTSTKSTIGSDAKDAGYATSRTSFTSYFLEKDINYEIIHGIEDKIHEILNIQLKFAEPIQGQWYQVGQEFKEHFDAFSEDKETVSIFGNRTLTAMIYLNNVDGGGYTSFPKIKMSIKPKMGRLIIWQNISDSKIIQESLHIGEPVTSGEKFILTKWFREKEWPIYRK